MKSLNTLVILTSVISTSVFAGAYVENREAYNLASDQMEFMLRVGYNSDMGAGIMLTNTYTLQRDDELKHGYNEIEGWYPLFKPTDKLTIQPGGLINDKSIGSGGAVYLDVNYKFTPWFNLTVRNRYNHNNYCLLYTSRSNGTKHHWEITNTFRYRINEHWLPYFELRWLDRNVGPYHREQNQIRIGAKYFF